MRKNLLLPVILGASIEASASTVIDVGTLPAPSYNPTNGTSWTLTSSCVDINDIGEAACMSLATGPVYRCGFRGSQKCSSKNQAVAIWKNDSLVRMSTGTSATSTFDVAYKINNNGVIGGYSGAITYTSGNGRIWTAPGVVIDKPNNVIFINDRGDYITESASTSGGVTDYADRAFTGTGEPILFPGVRVDPMVIGNDGEAAGGQMIQAFAPGCDTCATQNDIPEISGAGWLLEDLGTIPLTEEGTFDVAGYEYHPDGTMLWPALPYTRPSATTRRTMVLDINDQGDIAIQQNFGSLYAGSICSHGTSEVTDAWGSPHIVPWTCKGTDYSMGTYAGGKAFLGINDNRDAVGIFTPGAYSYQATYTTYPWVWLRDPVTGEYTEYNANDLLPPNSGWVIQHVYDINNNRQIVGTGTHNGVQRGFILSL